MGETYSLEWIGHTLRAIQAEQRTLRTETAALRQGITDVMNIIVDRIAQFETRIETRLDRLEARLGAPSAS